LTGVGIPVWTVRNGAIDLSHLYTYAAIVLCVDPDRRELVIQYLSDGLGADTDWEAFSVAYRVPADEGQTPEKAESQSAPPRSCPPSK